MTTDDKLEPGTQDFKPDLRYRDLRDWIEEARALGEIREVKGMSWQTDIGMAAEVLLHEAMPRPDVIEGITSFLQKRPPQFPSLSSTDA